MEAVVVSAALFCEGRFANNLCRRAVLRTGSLQALNLKDYCKILRIAPIRISYSFIEFT